MELNFTFDEHGSFFVVLLKNGQPKAIFDAYTVDGEYGVLEHTNLFHPRASRVSHPTFNKDEQAMHKYVMTAVADELAKLGGTEENTTCREILPSLVAFNVD